MAKKPTVIVSPTYNLNDLESDRKFEELLCRIFEYRIHDDLQGIFDKAHLMTGVREQGRDVLLTLKGKNVGAVQCKKYKNNLNKTSVVKEIIKFSINYIVDKSLIWDISSFQYYLAVSSQFSNTTINLLNNFNISILHEDDLEKWTTEVINEFESFKNLKYELIETELKNILSILSITPITSFDIQGWLSKYELIVKEFFEVKVIVEKESNLISLEKKAIDFLPSYYKSAIAILDTVKFIGYDVSVNRPQNIRVKDLYIEPFFKETEIDEDLQPLTLKDVFKRNKHFVFLGDAGAGKSLTIKNLMLRFIYDDVSEFGDFHEKQIPFRIELRKYNEARKRKPCSFISYLIELLKIEYQLHDVNEEIITKILKTKSTILFFDGLDEVFDLQDKSDVSDSICAFLTNYPKTKAIVTSRFLGYNNGSFSNNLFTEFAIQKFTSGQINEFIDKFYDIQITNKVEREKGSKDCKKQLEPMDSELKSNPLILSLMVLLALNHTIIPDSKLKVYQACTNTLVEKRDKEEKQLTFNLKIKSIPGAFGRLAFWRYKQMTNGGKSTQNLAIKTIAEYLVEKKEFSDLEDAEEAAKHFLDFAEKRSIYFDDNFTHKTFLEYFTADYILRKYHNAGRIDKRDEIIRLNINNVAWHIVFELLIAKIDEGIDDSEMLDNLFETHLDDNNPEVIYFFLGLLNKIVNLSDGIKTRIVRRSILLVLSKNEIKHNDVRKSLFMLIRELDSYESLKAIIQNEIFQIEDSVQSDNKLKIDFYNLIYEFRNYRGFKNKSFDVKHLQSNIDIIQEVDQNIYIYFAKNPYSIEGLEFQITHFGIESIFKEVELCFYGGSRIDAVTIFLQKKDITLSQIKVFLKLCETHGIKSQKLLNKLNELNIKYLWFDDGIEKQVDKFLKIYNECNNKEENDIKTFVSVLLGFIKNSIELKKYNKIIENYPEFAERAK